MARLITEDDMALVAIFEEAEGEPYEGKVAVGEVILNRTKRKYSSDGTVTGTVLHRMQFSGMNADAANRIRSFSIDGDNDVVKDCIKAWAEAKAGSNLTKGAVMYYNPAICTPDWAADIVEVLAEIGNHKFVRLG